MMQQIRHRIIPYLLRRRIMDYAIAFSLLGVFYWCLAASDIYVSEAHIVVQKTDMNGAQGLDLGGLLGGGGGSHADQLLLRDHLLSVDTLKQLDAKLNLRAHYSNWKRDPLSRMWFEDKPLEKFYQYFLSHVSVDYDDYAGILVIKSRAYDPEMAHAITSMLLEEGERHMNAMAHNLAQDQVTFLEKQVKEMYERVMQTRQAMLDFQNRKGTVSPQVTTENLVAIVNKLDEQRADLQTRRSALLGYLMPDSPNVVELDHQLAAVEKQLKHEQEKLSSSSNKALNTAVEEYQRLQMDADFAQEVYKTALAALEKVRIESTRTLKKVEMLQAPTVPQYPLEPRRIYNSIMLILVTLLIAGIVHLLAAIIRDHKD